MPPTDLPLEVLTGLRESEFCIDSVGGLGYVSETSLVRVHLSGHQRDQSSWQELESILSLSTDPHRIVAVVHGQRAHLGNTKLGTVKGGLMEIYSLA